MSDLDMLFVVCFLVGVAGGLWFLCVAFREGFFWGFGCIFVPFVALIFLLQHQEKAWKPFLLYIAGIGSCVVGAALTTPLDPPAASAPREAAPVAPREVAPAATGGRKAKKPRRPTSWQSVSYQ